MDRGGPDPSAGGMNLVAQIVNLPYRRLQSADGRKVRCAFEQSTPTQVANLRHSRVPLCATEFALPFVSICEQFIVA
jgi:hypothetical protein